MELLDVGCGDGEFTRVLASALPQTAVTAVDAKTPRKQAGFRFVTGEAEALPFEANEFDVVMTVLSMHHWADKRKGIGEAYRVLRPGGRLIIGDPLLDGPLRNRFLGWLAQVTDGGTFATPEELLGYLNEAGFSKPSIETVPGSFNSLYLISAIKGETA